MAEWKKIIVSGSGVAQLSNDANYLTDYTVTSGDVTAHEGDITITESQISDLGTYSTATGVENNADVTDTANVTAAGALMDSEVTDLAGIKAVTISTLQAKPSEGAFANGDKTKLDNIEANADVTDATNVTAAGALMDSEVTNLAQVKAFDSSDYATSAQGDTADTAIQPSDSVTDLSDVSSAGSGAIITAAERGSIGALNTFTGSLNANFATDAELAAVSGALASDISAIDTADFTNVQAAGALMDSEVTNLAQVKAFDSSDYATAAQGDTADAALPKAGGQMTGNITFSGAQTVDGRDVSADGSKLDGIAAGAEVNVDTNITVVEGSSTVEIQSSTGTNDSIAAATTSAAGVMTAADKVKLNGIDVSADVTDKATVTAALNQNLGNITIGDSDDTITIGNDLVVTGDLTVSGNTTTIDVANLNVTDQFINLNDGGSAADGGIVVEGAGVSFGWDNSEARWAFDAAGATEGQTAITADAYASAVVTSDLAAYRKNGNIRVTGGDIFIYSE